MRRRRTRGTWFPTIGSVGAGPAGFNLAALRFGFNISNDGDATVLISALTFDEPAEGELPANTPLDDILGHEYILQRIVGKLHAIRTQDAYAQLGDAFVDNGRAVQFGAGFFVARAQDADTGNPGQPIGSQTPAERNDNYNPLDVDCIREPWIWRRTWILGAQDQATGVLNAGTLVNPGANQIAAFFPTGTANYGSVMDGPHIDSKVKRRIRQDERLWFVVAAAHFPAANHSTDNTTPAVIGTLDYRLFGSLRKARNSSSF